MFRANSTADIMCLSLVKDNGSRDRSSVGESSLGKGYLTATALGPPELVSLADNSEMSSNSSYGSFAALAEETANSAAAAATTAATVVGGVTEETASNFGKRRKTSRADSPKSSVFDVAALVDAIHREVEGPPATAAPTSSNAPFDSPLNADGGDGGDDYSFAFIDISESAAAPAELGFPSLDGLSERAPEASLPTLNRRPSGGALGKRSRGLVRSQTVSIDLCLLGGGDCT